MLRPSAFLSVALLFASCAQAPAAPRAASQAPQAERAASATATIDEGKLLPAVRVRDYFMVPFALDGRDGSDGEDARILWMLYDTGASTTVVDPEALKAVSSWEPEQGRRINFVQATIGPVTISNLSAQVRDLDHIEDALGFPCDGILGYTAFTGGLLTLDYPAGEMRVREGALPKPDGEKVFRITRKERRRPFIEMDFGGRTEEVLIDSGSGSGFVLQDRRGRKFLGEPAPLSMMMGINGPRAEPTGRLDGDAQLFGRRFRYPAVRLTQGTELLGTQVLRHFALTFDISQRRVLVEGAGADWPEGQAPVLAPERLWASGVLKSATEQGHRVRGIVADSPAAALDLQKEDLLIEVNGVPHRERGGEPIQAWVDGARRYHRVVVERDGARHTLEVDQVEWVPIPAEVEAAPQRETLPRDLVLGVSSPAGPSEAELAQPGRAVPSPDGLRSAQILDRDGGSIVRVFDAEGRILSNPVTRGRTRGLQWSANGRWLAFWREVEENGEIVWSRWAVPANGWQPPEPVPVR